MKKILLFNCIIISTLVSTKLCFAQTISDSTNTRKIQALEIKVAKQESEINRLKNKSVFETPNGVDRRGSKQPIFPKK